MSDAETELTTRLVAAREIADPALAGCWRFVHDASLAGWLDDGLLDRFVDAIDAGSGYGVDEFGIECDEVGPDEVAVWFLSDQRVCSRAGLRAELVALRDERARVRALPAPPRAGRRAADRGRHARDA